MQPWSLVSTMREKDDVLRFEFRRRRETNISDMSQLCSVACSLLLRAKARNVSATVMISKGTMGVSLALPTVCRSTTEASEFLTELGVQILRVEEEESVRDRKDFFLNPALTQFLFSSFREVG